MKSFDFGCYVLSGSVAVVLLAGCGVSQPPTGAPGEPLQALGIASTHTPHRASASSYQVVYRFKKDQTGGAYPVGLTYVQGALYGVTALGGTFGRGTVYTVTLSGEENVLHSFAGEPDGAEPYAPLINVKGTLYGTTNLGGSKGGGTVYSISASGSEALLYSFAGGRVCCRSDGFRPSSGRLLDVHGTLYGTTLSGGSSPCHCGTVYSISTSGAKKVLYSFKGGSDGENPVGLVDVNGVLYGATYSGGTVCTTISNSQGCGTIYSVTTGGKEKVLYRFGGGVDGQYPTGLIDVSGTLYGTTQEGGASDQGVVYSVTTSGNESVLYSFAGGSDGAHPQAALMDVNGTLYGVTARGGGTGCAGTGETGCGTIFSISTNGAESVLYRFAGGTDGMWPAAPLINVKGTLYGTTPYGGLSGHILKRCCGTVFALTP